MIECEVSDGATAETTAEQLKQLMKTSGTIVCSSSNGIVESVRLSSGSLHHNGNAPPPLSSSLSSSAGHGQLVSANSFEMNAGGGGCGGGGGGGTSLSEDSGLPYTNSSVSSGDSIRCIGMLKLEMELTESEGEVSQFDSLDNCSDGGMSAENFNTLKKGPLAPIEPPPQFQDSPQTTLLRSPILQSFAMRLTRTLLKTAMQHFYDQQLQKQQQPIQSDVSTAIASQTIDQSPTPTPSPVRQRHNNHHHHHHHHHHHNHHHRQPHHHRSALALYTEPAACASGSMRSSSSASSSAENIYDVPNVDSDDPAVGPAIAAVSTPHLPSVCPPQSQVVAIDATVAATPPLRRTAAIASSACEIYDYDLYYRKPQQPVVAVAAVATGTSLSQHQHHHHPHHHHTNSSSGGSGSWTHHHLDTVQRKNRNVLYSPRHYPPTGGSNLSTAQRPNSRNSLTSRLSSSHNSLSVPTTNKADDSIFITQAMSHDTLTGREINDFYNVPIDSDIYSLPVDVVVRSSAPPSGAAPATPAQPSAAKLRCSSRAANKKRRKSRAAPQPPQSANAAAELVLGVSDFNKYGHGTGNSQKVKALRTSAAVAAAEVKRYSVPENVCEPMHMSLDEVKRFYHSLYSSSSDGGASDGAVDLAAPPTAAASAVVANAAHKQNGGHKQRTTPAVAATTTAVVVHNNNICNNNNNNNNNVTPDGKSTSVATALNNRLTAGSAPLTASGSTANSTPVTGTAASTPSGAVHHQTTHSAKGGTPKRNYSKHHRKARGEAASAASVTTSPVIASDNSVATSAPTSAATGCTATATEKYGCAGKRSQFSISMNLKQKFCSIFRFRRSGTAHISGGSSAAAAAAAAHSSEYGHHRMNGGTTTTSATSTSDGKKTKGTRNTRFLTRALPPLPKRDLSESDASAANADEAAGAAKDERKPEESSSTMDFAANIEKVKEYGWYWGPISSEAAEKILSNEPDGSFIVRDSSDDHYIFSLTFKLNNTVRHVRIEQDQGTFSFGSCAKFKSHTIMEFIENAVESSRSGRYLFFFHRRPEHGPMRVQLTNPVSRFKHIQSLQHMCRFVIRRTVVRKDLIQTLPLPRRLLDYLGYKNCFSEQVESDSSQTADEEVNNVSSASPIVATAEPIVEDDTAL